ncbi:hypothetical protein SCLCIDRAFT_930431 [Scleroderma citrinum Foug A]|uniref:Uncharacterized protein n=1 Tax=Scleroderma citrinum Foug A TaxID=1036808 RepID=A0A0C2ZGK4_9AGAM|nr:hypothetical protein SCLCIDRAFT_930431 [Scleroderma citrinum Foug A]
MFLPLEQFVWHASSSTVSGLGYSTINKQRMWIPQVVESEFTASTGTWKINKCSDEGICHMFLGFSLCFLSFFFFFKVASRAWQGSLCHPLFTTRILSLRLGLAYPNNVHAIIPSMIILLPFYVLQATPSVGWERYMFNKELKDILDCFLFRI